MKLRRFVMARRRGVVAVVAAALVATAAPPLGAVATSVPEPAPAASSVRDWNQHAVAVLMTPSDAPEPGAGQTPPVTMLHMAMVHGAIYDAVNAIEGGYQPFLPGLPAASPSASLDAAVATAAHDVLVGLGTDPPMPEAVVTRIDGLYEEALAAIPDGTDKTDGIAVGAAAAAAMLAARADDGRYVPFSHPVGDQPGEWRPAPPDEVSDPFAWVANVQPFTLDSTSQFRSSGPLALDSAEYTTEYNEVKDLGAVDGARSPEQQAIAEFHVNTVEMYNRTLRTVAEAEGLTLAEDARLFAMANVAGADSRDQLLGRQGVLALLASDHRHPRGRQRRQRRHRRRPVVGADASRRPRIRTALLATTASRRRSCTAPTPSSAGSRSPSAS